MPPNAPLRREPGLTGKPGSHPPTEYLEFELRAWRQDLERIEVVVQNSPAGQNQKQQLTWLQQGLQGPPNPVEICSIRDYRLPVKGCGQR
jgi:hypothetical protein